MLSCLGQLVSSYFLASLCPSLNVTTPQPASCQSLYTHHWFRILPNFVPDVTFSKKHSSACASMVMKYPCVGARRASPPKQANSRPAVILLLLWGTRRPATACFTHRLLIFLYSLNVIWNVNYKIIRRIFFLVVNKIEEYLKNSSNLHMKDWLHLLICMFSSYN